jgi:hypothetical protein
LEKRLAFADCHDRICRSERQQLKKPPDTAKPYRIVSPGPKSLELRKCTGRSASVPVVGHVEQIAAPLAFDTNLFDAIRRPTFGGNALLKGRIG